MLNIDFLFLELHVYAVYIFVTVAIRNFYYFLTLKYSNFKSIRMSHKHNNGINYTLIILIFCITITIMNCKTYGKFRN
jgi:hypothetical protein